MHNSVMAVSMDLPGSSARRHRSLRAPVKLSRKVAGLMSAAGLLLVSDSCVAESKESGSFEEEDAGTGCGSAFLPLRHRARTRNTTMTPVQNVPIDTSKATRTDAVSTPG
jgi:hypothetical protein